MPGAAMGSGALLKRICRLLEAPTPAPGRGRVLSGTALCAAAIAVFAACELDRVERPAPGQPTMNELMHRRVDSARLREAQIGASIERARAVTPAEARRLLETLKANPQDADTFWTLVRHYEHKANVKDLDALGLWYIEHQPGGKLWFGRITARLDGANYNRGKALWLAHLKRSSAAPETYQRAAVFLAGRDNPLAEEVLLAGQKAYPNDARWPSALGALYTQVLVGPWKPRTEFKDPPSPSAQEAPSPFAQSVRARLANSTDPLVLALTARNLFATGMRVGPPGRGAGVDAIDLARKYVDRALSIKPDSEIARTTKFHVEQAELAPRVMQLARMSPAEAANASDSDRLQWTLIQMRIIWGEQKPDDAAARARELLELAERNRKDPLYGDAIFDGNVLLGKAALRHGDKKAAARYLLAAAGTPGSDRLRSIWFEMNLPRALVDWGERRAVAEFLEIMAPKTARSKEFRAWAAEIRKGINPDLIPTFSAQGCSRDPC